jgi:hypothetical protein
MTDRHPEILEGGQEPGATEILPQNTYTSAEMVQVVRQLKLETEMLRLKDSQKHYVTRDEQRDELGKLTDKLMEKLAENFNSAFKEFKAELKADVAGVKAELKDDVAGVKADVAGVKNDVADIKRDFVRFNERLNSVEKSVGLLTTFFTIAASAIVVILAAYGGILFNMWGDVSSLISWRQLAAPQGSVAQAAPAEPAAPSAQTPAPPVPSGEASGQSDLAGVPSGTEVPEGGG